MNRIRPSSLPALAASPCWHPSEDDPEGYMAAGTERHHALSDLLIAGDRRKLNALEDEDRRGVEWAAEYIQMHAPSCDFPLWCERTLSLLKDDFSFIMEGTPDVTCGAHLFDLKWRQESYGQQMAAYAAMMMQDGDWDFVHVHILFGATQKVATYTVGREVFDTVRDVVDAAHGYIDQSPSRYCGRCSKNPECPALLEQAREVTSGYGTEPNAKQWRPSQLKTPEEFGEALTLWRTVVKKWGESLEFHALRFCRDHGVEIPGFQLQDRNGKASCRDVLQAFNSVGLPQDRFLSGCTIRLNGRKGDPGLIDIYADFHDMPKKVARRELLTKLKNAGLLLVGTSSKQLKLINDTDTDDESEE